MAKRVIHGINCKSVYSFRSLKVGNEYFIRLKKSKVDFFEKVKLVHIPENFVSVINMKKTDKFVFESEDGKVYDCYNEYAQPSGIYTAIGEFMHTVTVWEKE